MADIARIGFSADTADLQTAKTRMEALAPAAKKVERASADVSEALDDTATSAKKATEALNGTAEASGKAAKATDVLVNSEKGVSKATDQVANSNDKATSATAELTNAINRLNTTIGHQSKAANDNARATDQMGRSAQEASTKIGLVGRASAAITNNLKETLKATVALGAAFASLEGVRGFIAGVVETTSKFQSLEASLATVTGSATRAKSAMSFIRDFAAKTPFDVEQVTEAFIKLKSLGLEPSEAALTSYGNTASATGRPVMQFIEAVADAVTGEFERLKEFGIKASQDGEKVALTFQGVTKTIGNNASEITKYLQDIGNNQFAGAMDRQAKQLGQSLSQLSDAFETFKYQVGTGFADELKKSVDGTTNVIKSGEAVANFIGGEIANVIKVVTGLASEISKVVDIVGKSMMLTVNVIASAMGSIAALGPATVTAFLRAWDNIPESLKGLAISAMNTFVSMIEGGLNKSLDLVNGFISGFNAISAKVGLDPIDLIPKISFERIKQDVPPAALEVQKAFTEKFKEESAKNQKTIVDAITEPFVRAGKIAKLNRQQELSDIKESTAGLDDLKRASSEVGKATEDTSKKAQTAAKSYANQAVSMGEAVAALERQIAALNQSEGATAAAEFRAKELATAWATAREAGKDFIPQDTLNKIEETAIKIGALTDKLAGLNAAKSAVKEFFPVTAAQEEINKLNGYLNDASLGLTDIEKQALQLKISKTFTDASTAAKELAKNGKKSATDIGAAFIENVGDVFADIFSQGIKDGESFFDSILKGFSGLGKQLAAAGAKNLFGKLFGTGDSATNNAAAGIGNVGAQLVNVSGLSEVNQSTKSIATTTKSFAVNSDDLATNIRAAADTLGTTARDLATVISFETGGKFSTSIRGGKNNQHIGLIQFGAAEQKKYGAAIGQTISEQMGAVVRYLQDRGFKAGMGIKDLYSTINAGRPGRYNASDARNGGTWGTVADKVNSQFGPHYAKADSILNGTQRDLAKGVSTGVQQGIAASNDRWADSNGNLRSVGSSVSTPGAATGPTMGQKVMGGIGAGIGIFSSGYESGSWAQGGVSGALGGFQAAQALGVAGPIGAVAGAALGILGGVLGGRAKRKAAHQEAAKKWEEVRPQYEAFDKSLSGEGTGNLRESINSMWSQLSSFMAVGGAAWKMGTGNSTAQFNSTGTKMFEKWAKEIQEFRDGFNYVIEDLSSGQGLEGAFAKGRSSVKALKASVDGFIDDVKIAFGSADYGMPVSEAQLQREKDTEQERNAAVAQAQKAATEYALSMLYTDKTVSDVQKSIDGFRGTAAGLTGVINSLGNTASQTAEAIGARLSQAIANVGEIFIGGYRRSINDLKGKGYLNEFTDLFKEFDTSFADATRNGFDSSVIEEWFKLAAQNIVEGAELTGDAFNELITAFPRLNGVVSEFATTVTAKASEISDAIKTYEDRLATANNKGSVAAFDRAAAKERIDAAKYGATALVALEKTLAAERANVVLTEARETLDKSLSAYIEGLNASISKRQEELSTLQETESRLSSFTSSLKNFRDSLKTDSSLSNLNATQRLEELRKQYQDTLAKANSGDEDAQGRLTNVAQEYLTQAKDYFAGTPEYYAIFSEVQSSLEVANTKASDQLTMTRNQISLLEQGIANDKSLIETAQKEYDLLVGVKDGVKDLATAFREYAVAAASARNTGTTVPGTGGGGGTVPTDPGSTGWGNGSAASYLQKNSDVAAAIAAGQTFGLPAGLSPEAYASAHFGLYGAQEGRKFATGGLVTGAGSGTSDSIAAWLSNGEYVMPSDTTRRVGRENMDYIRSTGMLPQSPAPSNDNSNDELIAAIDSVREAVLAAHVDEKETLDSLAEGFRRIANKIGKQ